MPDQQEKVILKVFYQFSIEYFQIKTQNKKILLIKKCCLLFVVILHCLFLIEKLFVQFDENVVLIFHYHLLKYAFVFHKLLKKYQFVMIRRQKKSFLRT